ncbi:hypothetical protein LIA77_11086 [Sarocladium implicatum]|nr:hypothetical protein LIA77_11086 [Sarocladium implicatum]
MMRSCLGSRHYQPIILSRHLQVGHKTCFTTTAPTRDCRAKEGATCNGHVQRRANGSWLQPAAWII